MSNVYLQDSTLTSIGNAIRAKTGGSSLLLPSQMPAAIVSIPSDTTVIDSEYLVGGVVYQQGVYDPNLYTLLDGVSFDNKIVSLTVINQYASYLWVYQKNNCVVFTDVFDQRLNTQGKLYFLNYCVTETASRDTNSLYSLGDVGSYYAIFVPDNSKDTLYPYLVNMIAAHSSASAHYTLVRSPAQSTASNISASTDSFFTSSSSIYTRVNYYISKEV